MGDVGEQCKAQGWGGQTTGAHKLQVAGVAGKAEEGVRWGQRSDSWGGQTKGRRREQDGRKE
jgi:hypothetical protein